MADITTSTNLFNPELVTEVFEKVAGKSTLAKLGNQIPMSFAGNDQFVFTMDGEAELVGEGEKKPAGNAAFKSVTIRPVKIVYQHRLTDEFVNLAEEKQVPYLEAFTDGFAKKIARALDLMAIHGMNPATGMPSTQLSDKCFAMESIGTIKNVSGKEDEKLDEAVQAIIEQGGQATGIALSTKYASALAKIKANGVVQYPEFRFGQNPESFYGMNVDVNSTIAYGPATTDLAIVGDFANAFKWGYADIVNCEVINYGDPDGLGDLKRTNQIVLRAEAYLGWGILDPDSFKKVVSA